MLRSRRPRRRKGEGTASAVTSAISHGAQRARRILPYLVPLCIALSGLALFHHVNAPVTLAKLPGYAVTAATAKHSKRSTTIIDIGSHGHSVPHESTGGGPPSYIPYHDIYVSLPPGLGIALLVLWLVFLFSFLGIVASDFFCPNLSTLASRLGLPEDVAGSTLVGWANGAPDLFSTFAALRAGSGSLAIGELIGAASFICSVVAGSMALVKPFKVGRYNFFRDVGFFTIAVAFALTILRDGKIQQWEAESMIVLYVLYVILVAGGSWWRRRRRRRRELERLMRDAWRSESATDQPSAYPISPHEAPPTLLENGHALPGPQRSSSSARRLAPLEIPSFKVDAAPDYFSRPAEAPADERGAPAVVLSPLQTPNIAAGTRSRSTTTSSHLPTSSSGPNFSPRVAASPSPVNPGTRGHSRSVSHQIVPRPARFLHRSSILGAIEFRDVVNSLQAESATSKHLMPFSMQAGDEDAQHFVLHRPQAHASPLNPNSGGAISPAGLGRRKSLRERAGTRSTSGDSMTSAHRKTMSLHSGQDRHFSQRQISPSSDHSEASSLRGSLSVLQPDLHDPWRNAPIPSSRSSTPALSATDTDALAPSALSWGGNSPTAPTHNLADHEDTAGGSDLTLRAQPGTEGSDVGGRIATHAAFVNQPPKALRVLGLKRQDGEALETNAGVAPKAQRLLGIDNLHGAGVTSQSSLAKWRSRTYVLAVVRTIIHAIFPPLHNFRKKSVVNMVTSIISVPAVLLLNLTLPVVDESSEEEEFLEELEKERMASEADFDKHRLSSSDDDEQNDEHVITLGQPSLQVGDRHLSLSEEAEQAVEEEEREDYERNVRRTIAIAQELHSPVATHHHHSHPHPHAHEDPSADRARTDGEGFLMAPGPLVLAEQHVLRDDDEHGNDGTDRQLRGNVPSLAALEDDQLLVVGRKDEVTDEDLARYLTCIQSFLAPVFITIALLGDDLRIWYIPAAVAVGLVMSCILGLALHEHGHTARVLSLCTIGFFVACVWIITIVNEVVGVLQTIGHVFGLSDAIIGLTIFAMGNSLGDLVANVTVARMGYPLMALSACFGGPMLNILLGIGISGTYLTRLTQKPVLIAMSTTLLVSGASLLVVLCGTLITVPLNGYVMSRKWALGLIAVYVAVMSANIVVEVRSES